MTQPDIGSRQSETLRVMILAGGQEAYSASTTLAYWRERNGPAV